MALYIHAASGEIHCVFNSNAHKFYLEYRVEVIEFLATLFIGVVTVSDLDLSILSSLLPMGPSVFPY